MDGTTITTGVLGGIMGMLQAGYNNQKAEEREAQARKENYEYNEKAAQNADARTRALYNDLQSPAAMMRQYGEAGLSKSLLAGQVGGGGQTQSGAQGNGAAGISPNVFGMDALAGAEIAKSIAEARLLHVNADEKEGKTPLGEAQIEKLLADAGLAKAASSYTKSQEIGQQIANKLADKSFNYSVDYFKYQAEEMKNEATKTFHEAATAEALATVEKATIEAQIENAKLRNKDLIAEIALKWAQKSLAEQEKQESQQRMWNLVEEISIKWAEVDAAERQATSYEKWVEGKLPYIGQELELEAERLGIENRKVWIEGVTNTIRGVADCVMVGSCVKSAGKGGYYAPDIKQLEKQYKHGGNAINKGVPHYKRNQPYNY